MRRTTWRAVMFAVVLAACGTAGEHAARRPASSTTTTTSATATTTTSATATTTTTVLVQPSPPLDVETARCQQAVNAMIASWPPERVEAVVACRPATPGEGGHYDTGSQRAVVGVDPILSEWTTDSDYRAIAAHELGHAWDDIQFESAEQRRYMELRGIAGTWNDAAEDYADVFAIAMGEESPALVQHAPIPTGLIETLRAEHLLPG